METKISTTDEKHLTRAIEKAATIATVNDSLDRDELLAKQLMNEGVDKRFAKVASAAFNKRITVLTFQKTADEHRAEPFNLTDDSKVYELMGGETQSKSASYVAPAFVIHEYNAQPVMKKTASAPKGKPRYEDTVDAEIYKTHVESMIEKQAAEFSAITGKYESLQSKVKTDAEELANYFQKSACSSFEFKTAVNCFGNALKEVLGPYLPPTTDFTKTASAVMPDTHVFRKLATLIKEAKAVKDFEEFIPFYGRGLSEFSKAASMFGNFMAKAEYHGLTKKADGIFGVGGTAIPGILGRAALIHAMNLKNTVSDVVGDTGKAFGTGMANAINMYNTGRDQGLLAPSDVLDADFLIRDRFRDRLLSWSDMSADPQFAMYPSSQVFAATQKAMDLDSSLERPDRREVLRTNVSQLLAQNNRASTADVAALATTLKSLSAAGGNAAALASYGVSGDKVIGTDAPVLNNILEAKPDTTTDSDKMLERYRSAVEEAKTELKEKEKARSEAEKEKNRIKEKEEDRRFMASEKQKDRDNNAAISTAKDTAMLTAADKRLEGEKARADATRQQAEKNLEGQRTYAQALKDVQTSRSTSDAQKNQINDKSRKFFVKLTNQAINNYKETGDPTLLNAVLGSYISGNRGTGRDNRGTGGGNGSPARASRQPYFTTLGDALEWKGRYDAAFDHDPRIAKEPYNRGRIAELEALQQAAQKQQQQQKQTTNNSK